MNPGNYDIKVQKDATFSLSLSATDDYGDINFESTYTSAELKVWPMWCEVEGISGDPIFEMTTENVKIVLNGTSLLLQISEPEVRAITFDKGIYELKLINDTVVPDIVDTFLNGYFIMEGIG